MLNKCKIRDCDNDIYCKKLCKTCYFRLYSRKYRKTEKCRKYTHWYNRSELKRKVITKYNKTEQGKLVSKKSRKKYTKTEKGRAAKKKADFIYRHTSNGIKTRKKAYKKWVESGGKAISRKKDYRRHKANYLFRESIRRAQFKHAVPKSLTKEDFNNIKQIYKNRPKGYAVDHIIPLQNDLVCGLHVLCNLQYLKSSLNSKKKNKFDGTYDNNGWR